MANFLKYKIAVSCTCTIFWQIYEHISCGSPDTLQGIISNSISCGIGVWLYENMHPIIYLTKNSMLIASSPKIFMYFYFGSSFVLVVQ